MAAARLPGVAARPLAPREPIGAGAVQADRGAGRSSCGQLSWGERWAVDMAARRSRNGTAAGGRAPPAAVAPSTPGLFVLPTTAPPARQPTGACAASPARRGLEPLRCGVTAATRPTPATGAAVARPAPRAATRAQLAVAFAIVYVVWGSTYLAMRVALDGFPPLLLGGVRFLVAGGLLGAWVLARERPRAPGRRAWAWAALTGSCSSPAATSACCSPRRACRAA
jgi:hypothetical protein